MFGVELNHDGFFQEAESKWRPVDFLKEGVFACGIAHSPRSIDESIAMAEAAAQRALTIISNKEIGGQLYHGRSAPRALYPLLPMRRCLSLWGSLGG